LMHALVEAYSKGNRRPVTCSNKEVQVRKEIKRERDRGRERKEEEEDEYKTVTWR